MINKNNETVISFEYDDADFKGFSYGLVAMQKSKKWGYVNRKNRVAVPFVYSYGYPFKKSGFAVVLKSKKYGVINKLNKIIIPFQNDGIHESGFSEGLLGVKRYGKWGFVNTKNRVVIPFKYDTVYPFEKGKAVVEKRGVTYYIDKKGKLYEYTEE